MVGVGGAENDHAFLSLCAAGVAVRNALHSLMERVDPVTEADHDAGVTELTDRMVERDMSDVVPCLIRHQVLMKAIRDGEGITVDPQECRAIGVEGPRNGRSSLPAVVLEGVAGKGYQSLAIAPVGGPSERPGPIVIGDPRSAPTVEEMLRILQSPGDS